jgi:hypothetical protein
MRGGGKEKSLLSERGAPTSSRAKRQSGSDRGMPLQSFKVAPQDPSAFALDDEVAERKSFSDAVLE